MKGISHTLSITQSIRNWVVQKGNIWWHSRLLIQILKGDIWGEWETEFIVTLRLAKMIPLCAS